MEQDEPSRKEGAADACAKDGDAPLDWLAIRQKFGIDPDARPDKRGIERAFIESDLSLDRIGEAFSVSRTTVARLAKAEGWVRKVGTKALGWGEWPRGPAAQKTKRSSPQQRRREFVRRMLGVLDKKLRQLERGMAHAQAHDGTPHNAADAEREARSLMALARLYAQLVEIDEKAKAKGSDDNAQQGGAEDDAKSLRRELALRFERLRRGGSA